MKKVLFKSLEDKYYLLEAVPTHSQVVFRSHSNKTRDYNIEILFKGVEILFMNTTLLGIEISIDENLLSNINIKGSGGIYWIKDKADNQFYVACDCMIIYRSNHRSIVQSIFNDRLGCVDSKIEEEVFSHSFT